MGAWAFHGWQELLPETVEILPVELPGRNSRMLEPKGQSFRELVKGLVDGLSDYLDAKPIVVLGHSLGAWMAYEVVHELELRGKPAPLALVVSGARAPQLCDARKHDADRTTPCLAALPGAEFWTHFERRYGHNPDLAPASVKEYIEPLLRADFRLLETFEPRRTTRLACPVIACGANGDNRYSRDQLAAWAAHTAAEYDERWFDGIKDPEYWGTPHRYLLDGPKAFQAFLRDDLAATVLPALPDRPPPPPAKAAPAFSSLKPAAAPAAPAAADVPADREKDRVALAALVVLAAVALYSAW